MDYDEGYGITQAGTASTMTMRPVSATPSTKVHLGRETSTPGAFVTACGRTIRPNVPGAYRPDAWRRLPTTVRCEACDRSAGNGS